MEDLVLVPPILPGLFPSSEDFAYAVAVVSFMDLPFVYQFLI
jgi:hypothetical protein